MCLLCLSPPLSVPVAEGEGLVVPVAEGDGVVVPVAEGKEVVVPVAEGKGLMVPVAEGDGVGEIQFELLMVAMQGEPVLQALATAAT